MSYIERNRSTKVALYVWIIMVFAASAVIGSYDGPDNAIHNSKLTYAFLLVACALMWIAGIYSAYLVIGSLGSGGFPSEKAKLPVKYQIAHGFKAILYRLLGIIATIFLLVFPSLVFMKYG